MFEEYISMLIFDYILDRKMLRRYFSYKYNVCKEILYLFVLWTEKFSQKRLLLYGSAIYSCSLVHLMSIFSKKNISIFLSLRTNWTPLNICSIPRNVKPVTFNYNNGIGILIKTKQKTEYFYENLLYPNFNLQSVQQFCRPFFTKTIFFSSIGTGESRN